MKIRERVDSNDLVRDDAVRRAQRDAVKEAKADPADSSEVSAALLSEGGQIQISSLARELNQIKFDDNDEEAKTRRAKVERLKELVATGKYEVSTEKIAEAFLKDIADLT
jgi:flagellar biosynthesis anti-sigma factor FlgM